MFKRESLLFIILGGFFIANAMLAEFIGVKIFSVEDTLGITKASISLFGHSNISFDMTAGVLLWPVVFVMTDVINEYYGKRGVRILSWLAAALIAYAFFMVFVSLKTAPSGYMTGNHRFSSGTEVNRNDSFNFVFGSGMRIIVGSLTAFLIGQLLDAQIFHALRKSVGNKKVWLRATVSTLFSQLVDSFLVLLIAFYNAETFPLSRVFALGSVAYIYKFIVAILCIPVLYGIHALIHAYLGRERAHEMIQAASGNTEESGSTRGK
jgi:uncharacterized integral membrane protein (TIGR00697 family)